MSERQELTRILRDLRDASPAELDLLFQASYDELRRLARKYLARERREHTLQTTALVHEAYLRLVDSSNLEWNNRAHFLALAARVMRRILVDHARRRKSSKRGGEWKQVTLGHADGVGNAPERLDLVALEGALTRLQERDPEKARVVEMRFFAGMTNDEIAEVLGVTERTVRRHWAAAQVRLYKDLKDTTLQ